jgi:hypothetical protein
MGEGWDNLDDAKIQAYLEEFAMRLERQLKHSTSLCFCLIKVLTKSK